MPDRLNLIIECCFFAMLFPVMNLRKVCAENSDTNPDGSLDAGQNTKAGYV